VGRRPRGDVIHAVIPARCRSCRFSLWSGAKSAPMYSLPIARSPQNTHAYNRSLLMMKG
jgi:hypothetical protein